VRPDGIVGLLVPSGVAADKGAATFFRSITGTGRLGALLDFENGRRPGAPFFPQVHRSFKFSALVHGGSERRYAQADCAFFQQDTEAAERDAFAITPEQFARANPNTGTAPVFRTPRDAEVVLGIYGRLPVLVDRRATPPRALPRGLRAPTGHDQRQPPVPQRRGAGGRGRLPGGGRRVRARQRAVPAADGGPLRPPVRPPPRLGDGGRRRGGRGGGRAGGRAARRATCTRRTHNPYSSRQTTPDEHADPTFNPRPRYWVEDSELAERWPEGLDWAVAFRDIARPTDIRTVIACVVPRAAFGNTLPLLLPALPDRPRGKPPTPQAMALWRVACQPIIADYKQSAALLLGNLGALALDYVARNKVQSAHLNSYILEQLPMAPRIGFARRFGQRSAEEIVREEVLALSYTAHDLAPFARDQGCQDPPFVWDAEDRLRRRARLDAVFMLLYGLDQAAARHVLDTFPILRRQEESRHDGRFRTRDLVLRFMAAMEAGNPDARVAG